MRQLTFALILLALVLSVTGCGGDNDAVSAGPVPSVTEEAAGGESGSEGTEMNTTETTETTETTTEERQDEPETIGTRHFQLWFTRGDSLHLLWSPQETTSAVAAESVNLLLDTLPPAIPGLGTAIPPETRLLGVDLDNGIATVDLSSEFESGGGSHSMFLRLAQVVYTVTQFPTVEAVQFRLDGEPVDVFSAEGIVLDKPVTRKDYEELLPPIVVESPSGLDPVSSPIEISGTANVFEANVTVRLVGAGNRELARTFTTATCGSGCRGTFELSLPYQIPKAQKGWLIVSDDDADGNGRPQHEVRIALELEP
jgi:spore germination protein GerM